ncbi:CPBP family intramembrane glutamic endopeptidase [Paenibacillus eucommiae]|uniref:Membrane protease YdiL (CAAX protease family) n=1 Tax=Paenibacillus eucommiae TaxID=1355755 RepID=A0ABS4IR71_9BACL|nr:type II CAAX endopeptidase family protein [Paenibacillus eucommiae]MBP1989099.1 membrane protease YdiL (CAAX protease family) [Paenibacillus eucommiae]
MSNAAQNSRNVMAAIGKVLLALLVTMVLAVILSIGAALIAIILKPELLDGPARLFQDPMFGKLAMFAQFLGFIGAAWLMFYMFERKKGWSLGVARKGIIRSSFEGLFAGFVLITLICGLIWLFGGVQVVSAVWSAALALDLLGWLLVMIGVAVSEEIFARGYVQGVFRFPLGVKAAIAAQAVVFAMLHSFNGSMWSSPLPIINLLLAGILFGTARELSGGLWMPIGLHLSWNFMQGGIYGFKVSGLSMESILLVEPQGPSLISGGGFGAEGSLVTTFILIIGTFAVSRFYKIKK